ncbi:MAG: serine hydrolase [Lachnospiraceae bacterium]|nr:serine hydrolase [Lachnospiraceae bacterium]
MKKSSKKKKTHKLFLIMTVLIVLLFAFLAGILFWKLLDRRKAPQLPMSYISDAFLSTEQGRSAIYKTDRSFTSDLCIGEDTISLSGISVSEGESAALFSLDDRRVIYSKNMYERVYPASITKIMTALLVLKNGRLDDIVTISEEDLALEEGSQVVGLAAGDQLSVNELMRGLIVHSGNDAAMALARYVSGSTEAFVSLMNETLVELGATGSHFVNPSGLHDENHYTTVYDIYLMLNEALKNQEFVRLINLPVYSLTVTHADGSKDTFNLTSTDRYLAGSKSIPKDVTILGGKTGTTSRAGHCLALASQNAFGQKYISIIVGARGADTLYADMDLLLSQINE